MDYDDNDFQSQNFQLVGDDNDKFPPSLRPFALPKFDLDDHLQVHLRFDSLVESEVLLGIQGQENNWIEEFSPVSSAIEFSSSAAESCSISRRNNVWSEATSSESVEMLLKSVGEDEMIKKKSIIMEADTYNGLSSMDDQMDSCLRQDDDLNTKMEDIIQIDPDVSPDKCQKDLSELNENASGDQPQVEGMSQTLKDETSGADLDVSSFSEKFNSDGKIVAEKCTIDGKLTSQFLGTSNNSLVINDTLCETVENDGAFMRKSALDDHGCDACEVARESPDSITCMSTQDEGNDPSSISISNLVMGPGKLKSQLLSAQVVEEHSEISMNERSALLSDNAQKDKRLMITFRDVQVNDQHSEGPEMKSHLCSGKSSSFLEPTMDSLVLMGEGCNETVFSKNSDGLLETIAYQVKALNKDSETCDKISTQTKDMHSFAMEIDRSKAHFGEISNEDIAKLSHLSEGFKDVVYGQPDHLSKDDDSHVESTVFIKSSKTVDDELVEDVERPEAKLNAPEDVVPDESPLSALLNDAEVKISSSIPGKVCDAGTLVAEASDVLVTPLDVSIGNEYTIPSINSGSHKSNTDVHVVMEKKEDASPSEQKSDTVTAANGSPAKNLIQDESVTCLALVGGKLASPKESTKFHQSYPEDTLAVEVVVEQKKETTPMFLAPDFIHSDEKEVKISGVSLSILKSNLDAQIPSQPVTISDPVVADGLAPGKKIQDESCDPSSVGVKLASLDKSIKFQESPDTHVDIVVGKKEEAVPSPLESEMKIPGISSSSISKGNVEAQISSRPAAESGPGKCSPLNTTIEPQPIVIQQSSSVESSVYDACQNDLQSSIDNTITNEHALLLEGNLISHDSSVKGKGDSDSLGSFSQENMATTFSVSVEIASHDESQTLLVPASVEKSSSGNNQDKQQSEGTSLTPGDGCDRKNVNARTESDALNCYTNNSPPFTLSRSNAEAHSVEDESGKPSSFERNCGSPTVISCSRHSQDEMEYREGRRALSELTNPVSDDVPWISSETGVNADKDKSTAHDLKETTASEEDRSFTFEVGSLADLSEKETGNGWKPFSSMQSFEPPQISKENFQGCHLESQEVKLHDIITKTPNEDKSRHLSGSSNERRTTPKRKSAKEKPIPKKSIVREGKSCSTSPKSVGTVRQDMQLEEIRQYPYTERSSMKTSCSPIVQTSSLPDLNSSVSVAALFHQPFTDVQQVQLRGQIFVYGSLIQGIPPDEACMLSAFGETDGGRSLWKGVWHKSVERFQNQKSPVGNCETPLHSRSGVQVPEQVTMCSSLQNKSSSTSSSQSGSKVMPSAILSSTVPLPSQLWSISTCNGSLSNMPSCAHLDFNQALSPLHSYQSSQVRQYASNSTPWPSQSSRPGHWGVLSQSSTLDATAHNSTIPVVETVQVTPVRDSSITRSANMQLVFPSALLPTTSPSVTEASVVHIETQRNNKSASNVQKSRKRKKATTPEELGLTFPVSQFLTGPVSVTGVAKLLPPLSAGWPISANSPTKVASGALVSAISHISPTRYQIIDSGNTEQRVIFSEETSSRIEQAKLQAEEAATLAASAVRHSQDVWNQLATQKKSELVSEVEERLTSAAVAAAAAASVAKAAAAAAKVASDAALQAKLMMDETLSTVKTGNPTQSYETGLDVGKNLTRLTPGSILKGKDKIQGSNSIISAAREAARRRVEAASAATKQAENLDAVVKAAELAAEAVSQAGTIIAMGDPLPFTLSELLEAGPDSYWKINPSTSEKLAKTNNLHGEKHADDHDELVKQFNEQPSKNKEIQKTANEEGISFTAQSGQLEEIYHGNGLENASSTVPKDRHERDPLSSNLKENGIQKGSLVEVVSDEDGLRGVWFSARVLDVKDNKALVCYNDLPDEGSGQLKDWISLEREGNEAPRIRIAHPMIVAKYEGTRKRRREAVGNYVWTVGDRVDAFLHDGWWEGIVTEKSQGDDTKLTIHFPAGGDSSIVQAWNLRPSLIWKDGQWMEWTRARENVLQSYEGDTPQEKRQKLGRLEAKIDTEDDGRGIGKLSKKMLIEDSRKLEESKQLMLSAKDTIFSVGKNVREENIADTLKVKRTGMQKDGSRVVFGVPKPGKKRKFMEVSKHYVSDKTAKISERNDSIKFAKYLMPQASRPWRNTSKVDPKGKHVGDSKSKGLKSVRSQNIQTRNIALQDNPSITTTSASNEEPNSLEFGSFPNNPGTTDSLAVESSVQPAPGLPVSKKSSSAVVAGPGVKGRPTPAVDKPIRNEEKTHENPGKTSLDPIEPRRSSRRIQPTSRLLEGLQSSLIISKIPNFSHDKGAKAQERGSYSSRGNTHG